MLKWFKKGADEAEENTPEIHPIDNGTDLNELLGRDTVMIFKHSTACPVSWAAQRQVQNVAEAHPGFPLYIVPVIQERAASNAIAGLTKVRHESPQVILMRDREVAAVISHGDITASQLDHLIAG
jgi:bacillithiol system protein YtxJ